MTTRHNRFGYRDSNISHALDLAARTDIIAEHSPPRLER